MKFLNLLTSNWKRTDLLEIRCTPVKRRESYDVIRRFSKEYDVYRNEKSSLFFRIDQLGLVEKLLEFENGTLRDTEKICYSLCPRKKDENGKILVSGYDSISRITTLFFDIEELKKTEKSAEDKKYLLQYCDVVKNYLERKGLKEPIVIDSGAGIHFVYRIEEISNTIENREKIKQFLNECIKDLLTSKFQIDKAVKDISRVFGLPGSKNIKWNRVVKVLSEGGERQKFKLPRIKKSNDTSAQLFQQSRRESIFSGDPEDSLEWKIFISNPPPGEINNTIVFSFKLLLKSKGITDGKKYEQKAYEIYRERWNINPQQGTENKEYSSRVIINWMKRHEDWCKANGFEIPNINK